jgi:hypothetical protein
VLNYASETEKLNTLLTNCATLPLTVVWVWVTGDTSVTYSWFSRFQTFLELVSTAIRNELALRWCGARTRLMLLMMCSGYFLNILFHLYLTSYGIGYACIPLGQKPGIMQCGKFK